MTFDILIFIGDILARLWSGGSPEFFIALALGLLLGGFTWWLAHFVALSFNRQFSFKAQYHAFCAITASLTLVFMLLFAALKYTGTAAQAMVDEWEISLGKNSVWADKTFLEAYEAVYELRDTEGQQLEEFSNHPHPGTGRDALIPTNSRQAKQEAASVYARRAVENFRQTHPLLSIILWAKSSSAQETIYTDMVRFFADTGGTYRAEDAITLAGREIRDQLAEQIPKVVLISRSALLILFLLVQAVTFGLLIRSALADIKEAPRPN